MNNDFGVTSEAYYQWFSWVTKSLANRLASDPKALIFGNEYDISFLTPYLMSWTHNCARKQLSIADFAIFAKDGRCRISILTLPQFTCDVTRTYGTGIVTSYSLIDVARAIWRKGGFHKWSTAVNIDWSPPGIHGLACKTKGLSMSSGHFPKKYTIFLLASARCVVYFVSSWSIIRLAVVL